MGLSTWEVAFNRRVMHPLMSAALRAGVAPPTFALVETVGRRTRQRRQVPVANGLRGNTFWLIAGRADNAYVHNIRANPRVRIKARPSRGRDGARARWRTGTAHLLPDDDARARHAELGRGRPLYRLDGLALRRLATDGRMLTIRIDLDDRVR